MGWKAHEQSALLQTGPRVVRRLGCATPHLRLTSFSSKACWEELHSSQPPSCLHKQQVQKGSTSVGFHVRTGLLAWSEAQAGLFRLKRGRCLGQ